MQNKIMKTATRRKNKEPRIKRGYRRRRWPREETIQKRDVIKYDDAEGNSPISATLSKEQQEVVPKVVST